MNDNFFNDLQNLMEENPVNLFVETDVKTILGRNIVKNFLGKIAFEIGTFGYSESANNIAEFYTECKKNGGIISFFTNDVIKMILEEIQYLPTVKKYLSDRIFNDIEQEKIESLNKTFEHNEEIKQKVEKENQNFVKQKILKERKIQSVMKKFNLDRQGAENYLKNLEIKQLDNDITKGLNAVLQNILDPCGSKGIIVADKNNVVKKGTHVSLDDNLDVQFNVDFGQDTEKHDSNTSGVINLDDTDDFDVENNDNDTFWG